MSSRDNRGRLAADAGNAGYTPIRVGQIYRAKRPRFTSEGLVNDRQVVHVGPAGIQFDSPTIAAGHRLPFVSPVEFREWADCDVTALYGHGDWHGRQEVAQWQAARALYEVAA